MARHPPLIDGLIKTLEASGLEVTLRETHISWVLLAGNRAWKIKKPVNFGFLDFSTLPKRMHACEEELRLNSRFAPEIYLRVVKICGTTEKPLLDEQSSAIEYAVYMLRFDESGLLSTLADKQRLTKTHIDAIANQLANIHLSAPVAGPETSWGEPNPVHHWLIETLGHIERLVNPSAKMQASDISRLCTQLFIQIRSTIRVRNDSGFVRECHGDLHMGNMVWIKQQLVPFDCIEFNPGLRWIDVASEAAFVMMDLEERGYAFFAWRFINHYLSLTGDYTGLKVLRYYLVYRALVRAKVALLQRHDPETTRAIKIRLDTQYIAYTNLAERWLTQYRPILIIMQGLSASGKSTIAARLAEQHGCIHIRSDVERKRLHGLAPLEASFSDTNSGIYVSSASDKTYQRLFELASLALDAGYPVIVDAAFLQLKRRQHFQQLASDSGCPFLIVRCEASREVLESRISARTQKGNDPSEATLTVLEQQVLQQTPLRKDEPHIRFSDSLTPDLPATIMNHLHPQKIP